MEGEDSYVTPDVELHNTPTVGSHSKGMRYPDNTASDSDTENTDWATETGCWQIYCSCNALSFLLLGWGTVSIQQLFVSLANSSAMLGKKNTAVVMIAQFLPQVLVKTTTVWWFHRMRAGTRVITQVVLQVIALITVGVILLTSEAVAEPNIFSERSIGIMIGVTFSATSVAVGEVANYAQLSFYPLEYVSMYTAGQGVGSSIIAVLIVGGNHVNVHPIWYFAVQAVFAIMMVIAYFFILEHIDVDYEQQADGTVALDSDLEKHIETLSEEEEPMAPPQPQRFCGICMVFNLLWIDLISYFGPLLSVYFLYNFMISGLIGPVVRGNKDFATVQMLIRFSTTFGKMSSMCWRVGWTWIFTLLMTGFAIYFSLGVWFGASLRSWMWESKYGIPVTYALCLVKGYAYGSTGVQVMTNAREYLDEKIREFGMANLTQAPTLGQLFGNVMGLIISYHAIPKYSTTPQS